MPMMGNAPIHYLMIVPGWSCINEAARTVLIQHPMAQSKVGLD